MPITVNDPRPRTRTIHLDLSDPMQYRIRVVRETVSEVATTGALMGRQISRTIARTIDFDAGGVPTGDARLIALLSPIKTAIEALEAEDIAAEA